MALQKAIDFLEYARLDSDLDNKINQVISSDAGKVEKYKSIIEIAYPIIKHFNKNDTLFNNFIMKNF